MFLCLSLWQFETRDSQLLNLIILKTCEIGLPSTAWLRQFCVPTSQTPKWITVFSLFFLLSDTSKTNPPPHQYMFVSSSCLPGPGTNFSNPGLDNSTTVCPPSLHILVRKAPVSDRLNEPVTSLMFSATKNRHA
jgi:hypothetical protein